MAALGLLEKEEETLAASSSRTTHYWVVVCVLFAAGCVPELKDFDARPMPEAARRWCPKMAGGPMRIKQLFSTARHGRIVVNGVAGSDGSTGTDASAGIRDAGEDQTRVTHHKTIQVSMAPWPMRVSNASLRSSRHLHHSSPSIWFGLWARRSACVSISKVARADGGSCRKSRTGQC